MLHIGHKYNMYELLILIHVLRLLMFGSIDEPLRLSTIYESGKFVNY